MSEYWEISIPAMLEKAGIKATSEQVALLVDFWQGASLVQQDYEAPTERPEPAKPLTKILEKKEWWRDTSNLCGSDWVIAKQIHALIASR